MEYSRRDERTIRDYSEIPIREVPNFEKGRIVIPAYDNKIMGGRVLIQIPKNERE